VGLFIITPPLQKLLGLAVLRVLAAPRTILVEFQPVWIVAAILLGDVIALLALVALQRNYRTDIFLLRSHFNYLNFPFIQ
jgi:predicted membrane protein